MKKYATYKPELDAMAATCERHGIQQSDFLDRLEQLYRSEGIEYMDSRDAITHTCEHGYSRNGRNILFVEDQATLDFLMSLKFQPPKNGARIPFVHDSFSIAVPNGLSYDGIKIPPVLVYSGEQRLSSLSIDFYKSIEWERPFIPEHEIASADANCSEITVVIPTGQVQSINTAKSVMCLNHNQLIKILDYDVDDVEAVDEELGFNSLSELTREEVKVQLIALRLIVALSIYNNATDGQYLRDGVPFGLNNKPKHLGLLKNQMSQSCFQTIKRKTSTQQGERVVEGFLRNLQHAKYYQGVHANLEPKSRWVEVSGYITGEAKPQTQHSEKS